MVPQFNDLERELQRNLALRRELGGEIRLAVLLTNAAATDGETRYRQETPGALGVFSSRLFTTAWIGLGAVALGLGAFIAVWLA